MTLISLNLLEPAPRYPLKRWAGAPCGIPFLNLSKGRWPARGLLYSFLVHEVAIFSLFLLPAYSGFRKPEPMVEARLFAIDLNTSAKLVYFPSLSSEGERKETTPVEDSPKPAAAPHKNGLSYPGPQPIVSDVPQARNRFQTLLQPALEN